MTLRLSTNALFQNSSSQLNTLQSQIARTQMQLSTNSRLLSAADDPIAAARALEVTQSASMNAQLGTNRAAAKASLSLVDTTLQDVTGQIQDIQGLIVTAGNGAYNQADREALATQLEGHLSNLLGLANTADGTGGYLFGGYKSTAIPFSPTATGATYNGDQGQRSLQVGSGRKMAVSESGSAIFEAIPTGNGRFTTQASSNNAGTGLITEGTVTDYAKLTGHAYQVSFSSSGSPAVTTFTVTDKNDAAATGLPSNQPYVPGAAINFNGMSFDIQGAPANGDSFSVAPSAKQSVFSTVSQLISTLRQSADNPAGKAALANGLSVAGTNMKHALDNVLTVQASVGSRLKEVDYLDESGDDLDVQYQTTLSGLQDLDMVKAISLFTQQQQTLQAAQVSFKTMSGLSLFNYIS